MRFYNYSIHSNWVNATAVISTSIAARSIHKVSVITASISEARRPLSISRYLSLVS